MKVTRVYMFELEFSKPAKLPDWKGNLIRSALGYHLKKLYCIDDSRDCHGYSVLLSIQDYDKGYCFKKNQTLHKALRYKATPRIKNDLSSQRSYQVFVGSIWRCCRIFGLGTKESRAQLKIRRVFVENLLKNEKELLFEDEELHHSKLYVRDRDLKIKVGRIFKIKFLTPFRLLRDGAIISEPSFRDLITFMLRKYSSIRYQYLRRRCRC